MYYKFEVHDPTNNIWIPDDDCRRFRTLKSCERSAKWLVFRCLYYDKYRIIEVNEKVVRTHKVDILSKI